MKRLICFLLLICTLVLDSNGQSDTLSVQYASKITVESARKHLNILASDTFEGRDTGKPGGQKAAQYIADEFHKIGLQAPVNHTYFQAIPLVETKFDVEKFTINGNNYKVGNGFYMTGAGIRTTIEVDKITFIGYGISSENYDDLKDIDIYGKVVMLINQGEPIDKRGISLITQTANLSDWSTKRNKRIQFILDKNPALILAVSPNVSEKLTNSDYFTQSRILLKEDYKQDINQDAAIAHITPQVAQLFFEGSKTSYKKLKSLIDKKGKPSSVTFKSNFSTIYGTKTIDVHSQNVLGYLEGSDLKDQLIVISAHYDHIGIGEDGDVYNGADDDGSGTTAVLELAKAFNYSKKYGHGPRRSILFLAVTGEEKGLLGSDYYTQDPVFPLNKTVANLNIDMIGRIDSAHIHQPNYIYLIGSDKLSSSLHQISEEMNSKFTKLSLDYKYNDPNDPERIYYRSDHYNFAKNGIPVIFYFNGVHEDYHKQSDTVDKIEFDLLIKRTKLVFHTAWEIANRDQRLEVDSHKK